MNPRPGKRSSMKRAGVFCAPTVLLFTATTLSLGCRSQPTGSQPNPATGPAFDQALSEFEIGAAQRERELQDQRDALDETE